MKAKILFDNTVAEPKGATIKLDSAMLPKVPVEDGDYELLIENAVAVWTKVEQPAPPVPPVPPESVNLKGAVYTTKVSGLTVTDEVMLGEDVAPSTADETMGYLTLSDKTYNVWAIEKNTSHMPNATMLIMAHDYVADKPLIIQLSSEDDKWYYVLDGQSEEITDQWDYAINFTNDTIISMSTAVKLAEDASAFDMSLSERIYKFNDTPDAEGAFDIPSDGTPGANPIFELTFDEEALNIHALLVEGQIQMLNSEGAFALGYSSTEGGWLYNNAGSVVPIGDKWDKSVVFETGISVGFAGYKWMIENGKFTD